MLSIGEFARLGQVSPRALRHYAELGLIEPAHVDPVTGYRFYEVRQLADLHRVLALRDLGVALDQVRHLMDGSVEELRGMLHLREAEIAQSIADQQARLKRVGAHLDAIERGDGMQTLDIVVKHTEPIRMVETTGVAPGYGYDNIHPVFAERLPIVWHELVTAGIEPGVNVAYYDPPDDDGAVVVHLGFEIGDQPFSGTSPDVEVVELPVVEVASTILRGPLDNISDNFLALVRWIEASGHRIAGRDRELYLHCETEDPTRNVTELQVPISR